MCVCVCMCVCVLREWGVVSLCVIACVCTRRVAKTLDKKTARLCCLATDCDEPSYTRLIKALCDVRGIPLVMAPTAKDLGEWVGLCKIDKEGKPRKVVSCSCAAVTDYGEDTPALNVLLEHIKSGFGKE